MKGIHGDTVMMSSEEYSKMICKACDDGFAEVIIRIIDTLTPYGLDKKEFYEVLMDKIRFKLGLGVLDNEGYKTDR